jgi:hypothetical protein
MTLHEDVPQIFVAMASSCGKPPAMMGLHAMTCIFYLIKQFNSRNKGNLFKLDAIACLHIFLDRTQNYESNGTSFINFGAILNEI